MSKEEKTKNADLQASIKEVERVRQSNVILYVTGGDHQMGTQIGHRFIIDY